MRVCFSYFVLSLVFASSRAQLEARIISPLVYNTFLNSEEPGTFTCVTRNSDEIRWIVEGSVHNAPIVRDIRLIEVRDNLNHSQDDESVTQINIPAISINQHIASIKCRAYITTSGPFQKVDSMETAQFNVQGLLDMPPNITYSSYNISHNLIEWLEPETLNITNVEPDIENYTICTNITDEFINTTTTHFILPKYFVDIFVNVTAWNIVGESNNSAQLMIEACTSILRAAQEYLLEVALDPETDLTTFLISFNINDQSEINKSDSLSTSNNEQLDNCLYLYKITILQKNLQAGSAVPVSLQLYGYHNFITFKILLPRNQSYTINVDRITFSTNLSLNPVDFSTLHSLASDFNIRLINGTILQINYFTIEATVQGLTVELVKENETLLLRSFTISEECSRHVQSCSVHTSLDLSSFNNQIGKFALSVLSWEKEGIVSNVHYEELDFTLKANTSTNNTEERKSAQATALIITVSLGTLVVVFLGCVIIGLIIKKAIKQAGIKCSRGNSQHVSNENPVIVPNEAYSVILQMNQNEAYETVLKKPISNPTADQPHLYDEIDPPLTVSTSDPVYAEITEQLSKVKVL